MSRNNDSKPKISKAKASPPSISRSKASFSKVNPSEQACKSELLEGQSLRTSHAKTLSRSRTRYMSSMPTMCPISRPIRRKVLCHLETTSTKKGAAPKSLSMQPLKVFICAPNRCPEGRSRKSCIVRVSHRARLNAHVALRALRCRYHATLAALLASCCTYFAMHVAARVARASCAPARNASSSKKQLEHPSKVLT